MKLTKFSDYSLRLLLYLAVHQDRLGPVREVSRAYRVSPHILVKAVQLLVDAGLISSVRGRHGLPVEYAGTSADDRRVVLQILRETKPNLPAYWSS
ncbi:MAG TPA: Rrf2 family transcriptional regulator [Vicinamibacterales bacterium]|nr:Rrf2 family transcriptional regulator [Vicinamibacterales bacterium]